MTPEQYSSFAENERKTNYVPFRKYDWEKRARARLWGFNIPLLAGDITNHEPRKVINVVDNYGNWLGATIGN